MKPNCLNPRNCNATITTILPQGVDLFFASLRYFIGVKSPGPLSVYMRSHPSGHQGGTSYPTIGQGGLYNSKVEQWPIQKAYMHIVLKAITPI